MRVSKLLARIISDVLPVLAIDVLSNPSLNKEQYTRITNDAVKGLLKAFSDEWNAEHPNDNKLLDLQVVDHNDDVPVVEEEQIE